MYYSYVEIEYVAMSFSPARTDLALKLLTHKKHMKRDFWRHLCVTMQESDAQAGF